MVYFFRALKNMRALEARTELKLLECQKNVTLKNFMKKNIVDESFANIAKNDSLDASNSDNNSTKTL